jgi:SAM-dependent methyltransferase
MQRPARGVHPSAATGYDVAARCYHDARPSYAPDAVALVVDELGLRPGRTVVDVAAGTGKWTALVAGTGATVVAVEPVGAMRDVLHGEVPGSLVVGGVAEALPLRDGAADAATAATAFHWFRHGEALAELHRILRPGGRLAILRNERDRRLGWMRAYDDVLRPLAGDTPRAAASPWRQAVLDSPWFGDFSELAFPNPEPSDAEGLVARALSTSFVAARPAAEQAAVADAIRQIAAGLPPAFDIPYATEVLVCTRLD